MNHRSSFFLGPLMAALLLFTAIAQAGEKRVALVIGNAKYSALTTLKGPVNDAVDVEQALRALNYQIIPPPPGKTRSENLTEREMRYQISALAKAALDAKLVLLYYSGHGAQVNNENYLLPIDVAGTDSISLTTDGLELQDDVLAHLKDALPNGSSAVVVLDACRNDGTTKGGKGLVSVPKLSGFFIAFATAENKTADDLGANRRNSPYTEAFLAELAPGAQLPISSFFINVGSRVATSSGQEPDNVLGLRDSLIGLAAAGAGQQSSSSSSSLIAEPNWQPGQSIRDRLQDGSQGPEMVMLSGASFTLGSRTTEAGRDADEAQQQVTVKPFRLGKYEVSNAEFARFVAATGYKSDAERNVDVPDSAGEWAKGPNPGCRVGAWQEGTYWGAPGWKPADFDRYPVTCISWNDAQAYITWLNQLAERPYRLPSEAEQEYAIRAGAYNAPYPWGSDAERACLFANVVDAKFKESRPSWSNPTFACDDGAANWAPIGSRQSNAFGLFDMSGNMWEWSQDCYLANRGANDSGTCKSRVLRGGGWINGPVYLRSAYRYRVAPADRGSVIGFRLAQDR